LSLIQDLYSRFRHLIHEVGKFGVVGAIGFVVQLVTTNVLHSGFKVGPLTAEVVGYVVATAATYFGNKYWTYRHRVGNSHVARESAMFVLLNIVGILIQLAVTSFVEYGLDMKGTLALNASLIVGIGLGTIFRLFTYRRWVFLATPAAPQDVEALEPQLATPGYGHQPERGVEGFSGLGDGQVPNGNHSADHMFQPGTSGRGMQDGVVEGRRVHHSGQHRRLNDR
jgi:putative flippase GtrA